MGIVDTSSGGSCGCGERKGRGGGRGLRLVSGSMRLME